MLQANQAASRVSSALYSVPALYGERHLANKRSYIMLDIEFGHLVWLLQ